MSSPLFDGLATPSAATAREIQRVRVALPIPLDRLFDYRMPVRMPVAPHAAVRPGMRVRVRFAGRMLTGLVVPVDIATNLEDCGSGDDGSGASSGWPDGDGTDPEASRRLADGALAEIDAVLDEEPVVSESMIRVLCEEAREIHAPIGLALSHALPPGSTPRVVRPWALTPRGRRALEQGAIGATALAGDARPLLEQLARAPATENALARRLPRVDVAGRLASLARDGLVERRSEARRPVARVPTESIARLAPQLDLAKARGSISKRASRQLALLERIAREPAGVATRVLGREQPGAATALRSLVQRGLVVVEKRRRESGLASLLDGGGPVSLTPDQRTAMTPIRDAIRERRAATFLLHGVTGSGKTEVYLRAIAEARDRGRQALVLVPEITLTHQIVARLRARFGDAVAILHSGLRPGDRLAQWERLRSGEMPIAVGARSALFAPLERLGLLVIDEEHDGAYKNDEGFRYHARELGQRIAARAGCPLVLGSATPSLETRHLADRGVIQRLSLPRRVGGRPLPAVEIVDLGRERQRAPRGRKTILSRPLRRAIEETLGRGGQTILFLNRRGFSTRIFCFLCGHAERCDHCDVALVYHAGANQLRCHYCDLVRAVPEHCSGCGDPETALLGVGTERLEEETRSLFPGARTLRLDRDAAARRGHTEHVLRSLRDETVDIVIGTQMVAKGHDFPGVQLVGVVAADLGLHLPDFRAAERTFQLLTQVAGRAGRASRPGRVVVQTFVPDHYAIAPVETHDFEGFYREEIQYREALGYPPFGRLTRIVAQSEDEAAAHAALETLAETARQATPAGADLEVLGPAPAPIARLRGRYRSMLLLKGRDDDALRRASQRVLERARRLPREVQVALDARPYNML